MSLSECVEDICFSSTLFCLLLDRAKQILSNIFLDIIFQNRFKKGYNTLVRIIMDGWAYVILQNNIAHEDAEEDTFSVKDKRVKLVQEIRTRIPLCIHKFSVASLVQKCSKNF